MQERPKVGIGVLLIRDQKVLLGKRKNAHGSSTWALPGGHLEFGESWEACARREVLEETGIDIGINSSFFGVTNDILESEGKHYITLFLRASAFSGDPVIMEPDKCDAWCWYGQDELPENLFLPLDQLLRSGFKW